MAIEKAKKYGMGMVAARNSCHYGIAGYYATMATKANMIGITGTNARPSIAPTFGVENMLGTNPLTIGLPTDEAFPFVIDCATSITQRGKLEYYARIGKSTPEGMVIGRDGRALTNTDEILVQLNTGEAALAPLGGIGEELAGYKGYGYATVVEILSAALQQGNYLRMLTGLQDGKKVPYHLGHFFIAIDTEAFMGADAFKKTAGDILRELRGRRRRRARSASTRRARRSGTSGSPARTAACRSTRPCRRNSRPCATDSSSRTPSRGTKAAACSLISANIRRRTRLSSAGS